MRALEPTESGRLILHGFQIYYEAFGDAGAPAVLLLPCWQIVHSRIWKMQVHFLARSFRVIVFDSPGNGGGERTQDPAAFEYDRIANQAIGLLDHLEVNRAAAMGFSRGCAYALALAARWPERVSRLVLIGNTVAATGWPSSSDPGFWERRERYEDWEKWNASYWREHYRDWLEFFFGQIFVEPHSTKAIDDCVGWGLETTPELLIQTDNQPRLYPAMGVSEILARVNCPVLLIHGDDDRVASIRASQSLAAARLDWEVVTLAGCGHAPHVRDPVKTNLIIAEFLGVR